VNHFKDDIVKITVEAKQRAKVKRLMIEAENARPAEDKDLEKIKQIITESAEKGDAYCKVPVVIPVDRLRELLPGFSLHLVERSEWDTRSGYPERYFLVEW
jgi:hypothetical protein